MADYLKIFVENEDIKASETNSNNQFLLDKIKDNYTNLKTWLDGQVGQINSNINSGDATLQTRLNALEASLTNLVNNRKFTEKTLAVTITKNKLDNQVVSLSSYLPKDNLQYLVFVNARYGAGGGSGATLQVKSDVMPTFREILRLDGDSGRGSNDVTFCTVPVGTGRSLTFNGNANWINICGYMKV